MSTTPEFPRQIVFMGTPDFAVPTLQALINMPRYHVAGVVTQPDRPAGRGNTLRQSPIKHAALAANIPIIQPEKLHHAPEAVEQLIAWEPDFLIVVAFGQILRQDVLDIPQNAPINVHASLLPRWRGAAPIQAAILSGDSYTGITTMIMDAGMDTGPILLQDSLPIQGTETGQSLHDKLAALGAQLLIHTLDWMLEGSISAYPQPTNTAMISYAPQIKKEDGIIHWTESAAQIDRHVRAFTPWPGTFTHWRNKRLKILEGYVLATASDQVILPGKVSDLSHETDQQTPLFGIGTGHGIYVPTQLQLAGRKATGAEAFLNGAANFIGSTLGLLTKKR